MRRRKRDNPAKVASPTPLPETELTRTPTAAVLHPFDGDLYNNPFSSKRPVRGPRLVLAVPGRPLRTAVDAVASVATFAITSCPDLVVSRRIGGSIPTPWTSPRTSPQQLQRLQERGLGPG